MVVAPFAACSGSTPPLTATQLFARDRFFVAHRGSGDEAPEHTMVAYRNILQRGAEAIEISVHQTKDGVLVCHHDPTLARTCDGNPAAIADLTFAQLSTARVDLSKMLGPGWTPQPIPRLTDVLDTLGTHAVLFVEPKVKTAVAATLKALTDRRLQDTVVYKQHWEASGDKAARAAGFPVWNYLDGDTPTAQLPQIAARSDALGALCDSEPLSPAQAAIVDAAVATGKPVIAWALHRRYQADALAARGVRGFMCSSWTYIAQPQVRSNTERFASGRVQPGDLSADYTLAQAPRWDGSGVIGLAAHNPAQSLSLGSMSPLGRPPYRLGFDMAFDALPQPNDHAGVVIDRPDDAPYLFRSAGSGAGRLVVLRANGRLELRQVPPDNSESQVLAAANGPPPRAGQWETIEVRLESARTTVTRTLPGTLAPAVLSHEIDSSGGYLALTRNYPGERGGVRFRNVWVAAL